MRPFGPISPAIAATQSPPVMEARRWAAEISPPANKPLINLSQAAPMEPPPEGLRDVMAEAIRSQPMAHVYGPSLGRPELREALAGRWSADYGGPISSNQVAITAGCNMAFAAVMNTLAQPGDAVILPLPWYFNHKMWLDMASVQTQALPTDARLLPDPDEAEALITAKTCAIVLVTPNNPTGVEYPPALIARFFDLAQKHGIALVIDETYRDFGSEPADAEGWPHRLFEHPDWDSTLIHLYSFSKAYRMTGHRLGAVVAAEGRLRELEKFLDTVQICAPQIAQIGALWGLENLGDWLRGERLEVLRRRTALEDGFAALDGWSLSGVGAYFGYARHPFDAPSEVVSKRLLAEAGLLTLPGSMFAPEGDASARAHVRFAYANATTDVLGTVFERLSSL